MLVVAQVSSIKTRRCGSKVELSSNQSSRRFTMSGRSCSLACAVFFARDFVAIEKPAERSIALAHEDPLLGELLAEFLERQVWCSLKRQGDCGRVRFRPVRAGSPPTGFGAASPCVRSSARHRLTLGVLTPKSDAPRFDLKHPQQLRPTDVCEDPWKAARPSLPASNPAEA
jgi:hypothetical protein